MFIFFIILHIPSESFIQTHNYIRVFHWLESVYPHRFSSIGVLSRNSNSGPLFSSPVRYQHSYATPCKTVPKYFPHCIINTWCYISCSTCTMIKCTRYCLTSKWPYIMYDILDKYCTICTLYIQSVAYRR
jgi:hypothetical protein